MTIKRKICLVITLLILLTFAAGCKKEDPTVDQPTPGTLPEGEQTQPEQSGESETDGVMWFDDLFAAYYPAQLSESVDVIFSKAYFYGEQQTKQPVMCLCSKTIKDISLFAVNDGVKGEALYSVDKLEPMEVIWIFPELAVSANIGISFSDVDGNQYSYTIARNEDSTQVLLEEFAQA